MPVVKYVSDKEPTLQELQDLVGGCIQVVIAKNGDQIIMDEEGKIKEKEFNREATEKWLGLNPDLWFDIIVGDAVILSDKAKLT